MPLFKKKANVHNIADAYLEFLKILENTDAAIKELAHESGISEQIIKTTWLNLRIFAIDYATGLVLNNPRLTSQILESFYSQIFKVLSDEYPALLKKELIEYTNAVKTEHHLGITWMVGKTFCKFSELYSGKSADDHLGYDIGLIMFGSLQFTSTLELVSKFLKQFRIRN